MHKLLLAIQDLVKQALKHKSLEIRVSMYTHQEHGLCYRFFAKRLERWQLMRDKCKLSVSLHNIAIVNYDCKFTCSPESQSCQLSRVNVTEQADSVLNDERIPSEIA